MAVALRERRRGSIRPPGNDWYCWLRWCAPAHGCVQQTPDDSFFSRSASGNLPSQYKKPSDENQNRNDERLQALLLERCREARDQNDRGENPKERLGEGVKPKSAFNDCW